MITMTRTCHPDGRASTTRPGTTETGSRPRCLRKRRGAPHPTPSHTHRLWAAHTIRTRFECGRAGCGPNGWKVRTAVGKNAAYVLLVSTYELGHPPFGLAEPAAMLRQHGAVVRTVDLAVECLDEDIFRGAGLVAFYVPMHTATRLAARMIPKVRSWNPTAHIAAYGLYAPMNEIYLRHLGVQTVLGGEFEQGLVALAQRLERGVEAAPGEQLEPRVSVARQDFVIPDREGLPSLDRYAYLRLPNGDRRIAGYVEASRGCKHLCRHCPVVPVYNGRFRIIPREIVLGDVRQQAAAGARHITFGDPDFFNGPTHALRIVRAAHEEFPDLTYDGRSRWSICRRMRSCCPC
jgi:radical SAM superfamily enzyme YgiQ (UPF0313 family)